MITYIGTKILKAKPMTRAAYNDFRRWPLPANENGADEGYLVEYLDGGKPNTDTHFGYVSWSPKEQFDKAYRRTDAMTFGDAIVMLKAGHKVARAGWNGKGMWLSLSGPLQGRAVGADESWSVNIRIYARQFDGATVLPSIAMKTADGSILVGWLASQTDILAEDWRVVA